MNNEKISVYIHIPFCKSRCIYCDFVSFVADNFEEYTKYLLKEIELYKDILKRKIRTLYIGGGTPSIFPPKFFGKIISELSVYFQLEEFTVEVNPDSVTDELMSFLKSIGVNRISIGLQSVDDKVLAKSGRLYNFVDFLKAYDVVLKYVENINVDFIVGLPLESWSTIEKNIEFLGSYLPPHVSIYMLELHEETDISKMIKKHLDQTFARYDYFVKSIKGLGYERYEISNFTQNGNYCKHNMVYWNNGDYVGLGVSAGGHIGFLRYNNTSNLNDYFIMLDNGDFPRVYSSTNNPHKETLESLFMILRTREGLTEEKIRDLFLKTGVDFTIVLEILKSKFDFFDGRRLSEEGMDFSNTFFVELLEIWEKVFGT